MAEVVDSIVAELLVKGIDQYEANFQRANRAHEGALQSLRALGDQSVVIEQTAQRYKGGTDRIAQAEEQTTARVTRTRKARVDAAKASGEAEAKAAEDSAARQKSAIKSVSDYVDRYLKGQGRGETAFDKQFQQFAANNAAAIEREFQKRLKATGQDTSAAERDRIAEREARRDASAARRIIHEPTIQPGNRANSPLGRTVPREEAGQRGIPAAVLAGGEAAAAEKEVDRLKVDQITHQAALNTLKGAEKRETQDNISAMRLERQLRAENVAEEEILLRVESLRAGQARRNALEAKAQRGGRNLTKDAEQFARGAGFYQATGGAAAVAGIGTAAAVYGGIQAAESGINYAKQIAETAAQTGVSTKQIQVYQAAAREAGATNEQLSSSFAHLNTQIGRAKEGDEQAAKTFKALGVNIKDFASTGDALPTLIQRLAQIKDPSERAAVGTRLFSEEYRKLDAILGQGPEKLDAFAKSLAAAGGILGDGDIKKLRDAEKVLDALKNQLLVDLSKVVAGNKTEILDLARAFAKLGETALHAFEAIKRFSGRQTLEGRLISGVSSDTDRRVALEDQLQTKEGRDYARGLVQRQIAAIRGARAGNGFDPNSVGLNDYGDNPAGLARNEAEARSYRKRISAATRAAIADRQVDAPPTQGGKVNQALLKDLFAPKPPKGPKGPKDLTPEQLAAGEAERTRAYLDRLAGLQETNLRAQQQLTGGITEQARIERDLADRALKKQVDDIELTRQRNVARIEGEHTSEANKKAATALENAHAAELAEAARAADATQRKVIAVDEQTKLINAANQHLQTQLLIDAEIVSTNASLATTRKERLTLELRALDIQRQQEEANLRTTIRTALPGSDAAKDAQTRLDALPRIYAGRAEQVRDGRRSPLEQYRDQLKSAVGSNNALRDSFEQVAVNGIGRVEDQLASTIGKVTGLKGAFGDLATSIISDLARIGIEKGILAAIGGGESGSGSGIGSFFKSVASAVGGTRAFGGPVVGGTTYLVGERGPELFHAPSSGRIFPNNTPISAAPAGGVTQHITIDARNSVVPADFASQILDTADQRSKQHAAQAFSGAVNAAPARVAQVKVLGS